MVRRLLGAAHELRGARPGPGAGAAVGLARYGAVGQLAQLGFTGIAKTSRRSLALSGELGASLPYPGVLATGPFARQLLIRQLGVAVQAGRTHSLGRMGLAGQLCLQLCPRGESPGVLAAAHAARQLLILEFGLAR